MFQYNFELIMCVLFIVNLYLLAPYPIPSVYRFMGTVSTSLQFSRITRQTYFQNLLSTLVDQLSWFSWEWDLIHNISLNPSIVFKKGKRVEESVHFRKTARLVRLTMPYYSVLLVGPLVVFNVLRAYHLYFSQQCSM